MPGWLSSKPTAAILLCVTNMLSEIIYKSQIQHTYVLAFKRKPYTSRVVTVAPFKVFDIALSFM